MTRILIVYATDYGNTKKMADAIAEGVRSTGAEALMLEAEKVTKEDVLSSQGLIIGSPVHMGSADWRVKKFIDTVCSPLWMKDALIGRVGGVFASGGGFGGSGAGAELTLLGLMANLAELGMILVPLPKNTPEFRSGGIHWGACGRSGGPNMEHTGVTPEALKTAFHHGANIARIAEIHKNHSPFLAAAAKGA